MASKPKESEYEASAAEKMSASVGLAEKNYFDNTYGPLLREERDLSEKENFASVAKGRANADVAQTLDKPSLAATRSVDASADRASAGASMASQAQFQALAAQRKRQVDVLGKARGQQADATSGLAAVARIENTKTLSSAKRKLQNRQANIDFGMKIGETLIGEGIGNLGSGGSFFKPKAGTARAADREKGWSTLGTMITGG